MYIQYAYMKGEEKGFGNVESNRDGKKASEMERAKGK